MDRFGTGTFPGHLGEQMSHQMTLAPMEDRTTRIVQYRQITLQRMDRLLAATFPGHLGEQMSRRTALTRKRGTSIRRSHSKGNAAKIARYGCRRQVVQKQQQQQQKHATKTATAQLILTTGTTKKDIVRALLYWGPWPGSARA